MKLRTDNIHKLYKGRKVVNGVSVEVNQGEIVGLLGPNGAGKTTSFYMIVGLISPNSGHVYLDDIDITNYPMYKRAKLGIGYLPQEVSVFRKMSVEDNIMSVLEMTKLNREQRKSRLEELLAEFGLQHVRKNLGQSLSGGEKRRIEIARALATDPKFILLDEPFAGVDPIAVEDIQYIVWKLKSKNIGVLITDHNVQETLSITDRTYLLYKGGILKSGTAEDLAADQQVKNVYLGHDFELKRKDFSITPELRAQREYENKTPQEKNAHHVNIVLKIAKRASDRINGVSKFKYQPTIVSDAGLENLLIEIENLINYFSDKTVSSQSKIYLGNLKFGPIKRYFKINFGSSIVDKIISYIPLLNQWMIVAQRRRLARCKNDLNALIENLENLKLIIENPDIEKMSSKN